MNYWEKLNSKDLLELYDSKLEALWLQPVLYFFFRRDIQYVREENRKFSLNLTRVIDREQFLNISILNLIKGFEI